MSNKKFSHYIPYKMDQQPPWAENMKLKIVTHATTVGVSVVEVTDVGDACQAIIDANNRVLAKRLELDEAINHRNDVQKTQVPFLRKIINRIKNHVNFTTAIGGELGIMGSSQERDMNTIQPKVKLVGQVDSVKVYFNLQGMRCIGIYSRIKGSLNWEFLAYNYASPHIDRRPLAHVGVAEVREYMAVYFNGHENVGLQSSIETIVFGGPLNSSL